MIDSEHDNCTSGACQALVKHADVQGFPTIHMHVPGNTQPIVYQGDRSADSIIKFVKQYIQ